MFTSKGWKFVGGFLGIIALALAGLAVSGYFFSPEKKAERELRDLERQYAEDTYGGTTPEETLELFIAALESGDIELASKYFVVDERTAILRDLRDLETKDGLKEAIERLKRMKLVDSDADRAYFHIVDADNVVLSQSMMARGPNNIWKIVDM